MYGNKSIKHRKDGTKYSDYFYYGCKHRNMTRGHKCDYRKQVSEIKIDGVVVEVLRKLVSNKRFARMMREKINMEVDTTALDQEISAQEKTLRQSYLNKDAILSDLDNGSQIETVVLLSQQNPDDRIRVKDKHFTQVLL